MLLDLAGGVNYHFFLNTGDLKKMLYLGSARVVNDLGDYGVYYGLEYISNKYTFFEDPLGVDDFTLHKI